MTVAILDTHIDFPIATVTLEDEWGVLWSLDFELGGWVARYLGAWVIDEEGQPRSFDAPPALVREAYDELEAWGESRELCGDTPR